MASEIDICNLALAHIGDIATVASISPADSVQAEHCARFYPIARRSLLEMHQWGFSITRISLSLLDITSTQWDYVYSLPLNMINAIALLPPDVIDDYSTDFRWPYAYGYDPEILPAAGFYSPQPYVIEVLEGQNVIMSDQEDATFRYTADITDTTKFSPLFTTALSWFLASMLAGPIIKGEQGAAEATRCLKMMNIFLAEATASDSIQRNIHPKQIVPWMAGR